MDAEASQRLSFLLTVISRELDSIPQRSLAAMFEIYPFGFAVQPWERLRDSAWTTAAHLSTIKTQLENPAFGATAASLLALPFLPDIQDIFTQMGKDLESGQGNALDVRLLYNIVYMYVYCCAYATIT